MGGQSVPMFDYYLAPYIKFSYAKHICKAMESNPNLEYYTTVKYNDSSLYETLMKEFEKYDTIIEDSTTALSVITDFLSNTNKDFDINALRYDIQHALKLAYKWTDSETFQAMEGLVHNLNTLASRAGNQVPFSSINFGTNTQPEGRMITKNLLLAQEEGLGNKETPIFPILVFTLLDGKNYNKEDPNYDLFKLACRVSAKRLFPNFLSLIGEWNRKYYKEGRPETLVAVMGCRTRVIGNINNPDLEVTPGRGNLSFTSINLPKLGILADKDVDKFFTLLDEIIDKCIVQLLDRFELQGAKKAYNFPFLIQQGIWIGGKGLKPDDPVKEVLKNGTLSIGFVGLAECLISLIGKHHGESDEAQELGLRIVRHMRNRMDEATEKYKLNFTLIASPAESTCYTFAKSNRREFGYIKGVTDREFQTNGNHLPVWYNCSIKHKVDVEAPYHELCNAGW